MSPRNQVHPGTHSAAAVGRAVHRIVIMAGVSVLASCGTDAGSVALHPVSPRRVVASDVTMDVLPAPSGVTINFTRGVSAAGFIYGVAVPSSGPSVPYAWTRPYSAPPAAMAASGSLGGLDAPTDAGYTAGEVSNTEGFWSPTGSGWTFTAVATAPYTGANISGIENDGTLIGWGTRDGIQRALWWASSSATPSELPIPSVSGTLAGARALAANNNGAVVGELRITTGTGRTAVTHAHAILWTPQPTGWSSTVLPDAAADNRAYDINDAGLIAGNAGGGAVLWTSSGSGYTATIVVTSQGALSKVDACGRLIGYLTGSQHRAFVWENGVTTVLPIPAGNLDSEAESIAADPSTGRSIIAGRTVTPKGTPTIVRWSIPGCP